MKFDFVIGNPPYQEESETESLTNGQRPRKNIFHYFQIEADAISKKGSVLIYPGGRWIHQSGKGLKQFGKDLINDKRLSTVEFYPNAKEVFGSSADLTDGVTIVTKKQDKKKPGFEYIYLRNGNEQKIHADNPGDDLIPLNPTDITITEKIKAFVAKKKIKFLHEAILPRSLFGIESDFVAKHPNEVKLLEDTKRIDFNKKIKLLANDKAGSAGRSKWFVVNKSIINSNTSYINEWQVVVSSAHGGGQDGRDNRIEIIDNHSAYGRSRIGLRSFKTYEEAKNFFDYAQTYLIRYAFLMTDEALNSLGLLVPDIMDYSTDNSIINFTQDINKQLFNLINLSPKEISYVKDVVNNSHKGEVA